MVHKIIGKCECINYDHKYLILRIAKEAIEKEKDVISIIYKNREDIIKKGMNPDIMIQTEKQFVEKIEDTIKAVKDVPVCK